MRLLPLRSWAILKSNVIFFKLILELGSLRIVCQVSGRPNHQPTLKVRV